jgi:hypothetical protein
MQFESTRGRAKHGALQDLRLDRWVWPSSGGKMAPATNRATLLAGNDWLCGQSCPIRSIEDWP